METKEIKNRMIEKMNSVGEVKVDSYENLMETANKLMIKFI
jgi:hypothetical protein